MKAVLVIEEMPTECIECPFCRVYSDCKLTETHCIWMATTNEDGINTRAEWCPLRPLPEKDEEPEEEMKDFVYKDCDRMASYFYGLIIGRNNVINEILGEHDAVD